MPTDTKPDASAQTSSVAHRSEAVTEFLLRTSHSPALSLCALALGNFLLFYVTNIALARRLPLRDFDDYSVAVSMVTVLSTIATLGLEKYALRCIPVYRERADWGHALGYWRFSMGIVVACSVLLIVVVSASLEIVLVSRRADTHAAVLVLTGFLPIISVVLLLVEIATATGAQIQAVVIYRFLLPASFFILVHLSYLFGAVSTAIGVAICYGLAWLLALISAYYLVQESMPTEVWDARASFLKEKWLLRASPFLVNSWMLSVIASSGVIILEILYTSESVVGTYAVAAQTGTFIVLLANTTNRYYLPLMSLFMERRDKLAMRRVMRHRLAVIGGLALVFVWAIIVFGEIILGWFGTSFREGYDALCVLAIGASLNAVFSDSPYYLQFMKHGRGVLLSTTLGVIINLSLTASLGYHFGALGAAYGYTISMGLLFLSQRLQAAHHFKHYWNVGEND